MKVKGIYIRNFTVFGDDGQGHDISVDFAPGINVIHGVNGSGKTHLLKLVYSILAGYREESSRTAPSIRGFQLRMAEKLVGVFRPDYLGRLVRRRPGRTRCEIRCYFAPPNGDIEFHFASNSKSEVGVDRLPKVFNGLSHAPTNSPAPVYLPTRELLTIFPGFLSLYEKKYLEFEETWRDTCLLLGEPVDKGSKTRRVRDVLHPLERAMGGTVELDSQLGRFYLNRQDGRMEMPLVAEGFRKFAMIARLIATGGLLDKGCIFWDEPEANMNPKLVKEAARVLFALAKAGTQVFVATHSLFLMRELHVLRQESAFRNVNTQYIGLFDGDNGIRVVQGPTIDDCGSIAALDEELEQSNRFLAAETK